MTTPTDDTVPAQRCPHCGSTLAGAEGRAVVGRPLSECASCGGVVVRRGAGEWALLGAGQKLDFVVRHAALAAVTGLVAPLIHLAATRFLEVPWRPFDAAISLAAGWLVAGGWMASRLLAAIRRSQRRMRDPMYLAKLVQNELATPRR